MRAELAVATGSWPEANKAFISLIALQEQLEVRLYRAATLWDWALALINKGAPEDISEARKLAEEAEAEFIEMNLPYFIKKSKLLIKQLT